MEKVKLTDICDFQGGSQPPKEEWSFDEQEGYIRMLQIRDFTQGERVTPEYIKISNTTKMCEANDILIARYGASIGKILTGLAGAYNVAIMRTIPDTSRIKKLYLYYYLKSPYFQNAILNVGSRAAQAGFNKEDLSKLDIECPELIKQDKIIAVLEKLECIIEKRKIELSNLDDLIKARFVEMFGDPVKNPKGWEVVTIGDIVTEVRYGTSKPAVEGGKYPYLRMNNLTADGHLDLNDLKYIDIPDDEIEKCVVRKGDVLFNRTNSIELVGKTVVFDLQEDMIIAGYIIRVRLNKRLLPEILSQYMNLEALKDILRSMAKGAVNQANINAQELQSIKVYIPDMELQKQFIEMKNQVDKSKVAVQKALDETQILFDSLMQKYFG
jgi:type I restriction enzyme S subunit